MSFPQFRSPAKVGSGQAIRQRRSSLDGGTVLPRAIDNASGIGVDNECQRVELQQEVNLPGLIQAI